MYLQVPLVYLIDDVQVTRQQIFEEVDRPALQSLGQNGVIRVGTGANHNVPTLDRDRPGSEKNEIAFET